jgi:transposase InsO family protein
VSVLSSATVRRLIDSVAVVLSQAYQLARVRLASAASPVLRLLVQRDQAITETELLRRELAILRAQRNRIAPHRRPDYAPSQRLAILQLRRLRGWTIVQTADHFVLHPNTVRSWISAAEGGKKTRLFADALSWNRIDDAVRWAVQEIRRFCPEPEFGTRTMARHLIRAGIAISRSTVQRVLREETPTPSSPHKHAAMAVPLGEEPDHLLTPTEPNHVWHMDFTCLRILWCHFTLAAVLDGFSRKVLCLRLYCQRPRSTDVIRLLRSLITTFGKPHFLITDHGCQFRKRFSAMVKAWGIHHVRGRVRTPFLNGKIERAFRTFRLWWRVVLTGLSARSIQRHLNDYQHWYNHYRPHSALDGMTPEETWGGEDVPQPLPFRTRDVASPHITVRRVACRGDPRLPVLQIAVRRAA